MWGVWQPCQFLRSVTSHGKVYCRHATLPALRSSFFWFLRSTAFFPCSRLKSLCVFLQTFTIPRVDRFKKPTSDGRDFWFSILEMAVRKRSSDIVNMTHIEDSPNENATLVVASPFSLCDEKNCWLNLLAKAYKTCPHGSVQRIYLSHDRRTFIKTTEGAHAFDRLLSKKKFFPGATDDKMGQKVTPFCHDL